MTENVWINEATEAVYPKSIEVTLDNLRVENKNLKSMLQYCHKYAKQKGFEILLPSEILESEYPEAPQ